MTTAVLGLVPSTACTFAGRAVRSRSPLYQWPHPQESGRVLLGSIDCWLVLGSPHHLGVPWAGGTVDLPVGEPQG